MRQRFVDTNGGALAYGQVRIYWAGTRDLVPLYFDSTRAVVVQNPIVLDGRGECAGVAIPADKALDIAVYCRNGARQFLWEGVASTTMAVDAYHEWPLYKPHQIGWTDTRAMLDFGSACPAPATPAQHPDIDGVFYRLAKGDALDRAMLWFGVCQLREHGDGKLADLVAEHVLAAA